jgi:glyoxylase-like metal-dependent hydrolase (beta-lactamase superfamily II)
MSLYRSTPRDDLPALPKLIKLSERVWRVMGLNPGPFTLQGNIYKLLLNTRIDSQHGTYKIFIGTNTYLVGKGNRLVLIDCGSGEPGYLELLTESIQKINPDAYISDILITHCHKDHWGGLDEIMASDLNSSDNPIAVHKYPYMVETTPYKHLRSFPHTYHLCDLKDQQAFEIDADTNIKIVHTPGHSVDHCVFYLTEEKAVFTADCILGHGSVAFENLSEYLNSLRKIKDLEPVRLFPGHGDVIDAAIEKVDQYISQREAKENQIVGLFTRDISKPWTATELVKEMNGSSKNYTDQMLMVVVRTVSLHLIKLQLDGRVQALNYDGFIKETGFDPYNTDHVHYCHNVPWVYCPESKL